VPDRFELADSKRELSNVGVYPLVQLLSLVGRNVRRVTATTGNYFFAEHQRNNMEDFGQMLLELEGETWNREHSKPGNVPGGSQIGNLSLFGAQSCYNGTLSE